MSTTTRLAINTETLAWVAAYLRHLTSERMLSSHTVSAYRRDLHELARLAAVVEWHAVRSADIRRCASSLRAKNLDARSIARKLSAWRGFFNWLGQQDSFQNALAVNPVDGVRAPKRARTLPRALSVDDAVHLVSSLAEATPFELCNRAMFELLYSSGLRVSELAGLDLHYQKLQAPGAGPGASLGWIDFDAHEVIVTGKGSKMRKVPVGSCAIDAMTSWLRVRPEPLDGSNALFLNSRARRISPRVLQLRLKAHGQAAGTPVNVHPHVLRHSFASHVLQSSGDLRAVQEMLGHTSITSTQIYTSLDFQHLALVYDKTHPRAKAGK